MYIQLDLFKEIHKPIPPHYDNPKNDNEKLMNLQYEYLVKNDLIAYEQLWSFGSLIARRMIITEAKKQKFPFDKSFLEEKSIDAMIYILKRYNQKEGYYLVTKNYISAIYWAVQHALYYENLSSLLERLTIDYMNDNNTTLPEALDKVKKQIQQKISKKKNKKIKNQKTINYFWSLFNER